MGKNVQAVVINDFEQISRDVPEGAFFEKYVKTVDAEGFEAAEKFIHDTNFVYDKADGTEYTGGLSAFQQFQNDYGVFTKWYHEPRFASMAESVDIEGAFEIMASAILHHHLVGPDDGASKVTDRDGKQWDGAVPGAFHLWIEKADEGFGVDGFVLTKTSTFTDSGPIVMRLLKGGVIKPQDLGL